MKDNLRELTKIHLQRSVHHTRLETEGISIKDVGKIIAKEYDKAEMKALIMELEYQVDNIKEYEEDMKEQKREAMREWKAEQIENNK